jgi:hypothetical protein
MGGAMLVKWGKGEERAGGDLLKLKLAQLGRAGGQHQRGGAETLSDSVAIHGLDGLISDNEDEEDEEGDGSAGEEAGREQVTSGGSAAVVVKSPAVKQGSRGEGDYGRMKQHKLWVQVWLLYSYPVYMLHVWCTVLIPCVSCSLTAGS